ncbi:MAG: methionine biosynthesis protein MetW [Gammaproteobacteria bacterium]|nr:methionine biosynthesis protein MetW [Gammaproteobacteria bacterium]
MLPVSEGENLRTDLAIIANWISPNSKVLDLGCGDGVLLAHLRDQRNVRGYGLEINVFNIETCVEKGINVIQSDLNDGLKAYFADNSFDSVIMSQTLQATEQPDLLIEEMLRVGAEGIVTFPNMAHWKARIQLGLKGVMPVTKNLPNQWFNTPNVHLCTLNDFEVLCKNHGIHILQRTVVDHRHKQGGWLMKLFPNLLGEIAIYRFCRRG